MGVDLQGIKHIVLNGFKASFLPFHEKQELMRRVSRELERFHADGTIDAPRPVPEAEAKGAHPDA